MRSSRTEYTETQGKDEELGPGLIESVYKSSLLIELGERGLRAEAEVALPVYCRGRQVAHGGLRLDLPVEERVVVELRSMEKILPVHAKQVLSYLRLAKSRSDF